ncbi:MAG: rhodanese-like domain-containing protein [Gammaproteobacteria bacterium]
MQDIIEFTNQNIWLVAGLVASGLAVIIYELRLKARGIGSLSTSLAVRAINNGTAVVDVRSAEQFAGGHIVEARNIPADELDKAKNDLAKNKKGTVLVCDNGIRSAECAARLRKDGVEKVFSLKGGVVAWQQENLPVVSDGS